MYFLFICAKVVFFVTFAFVFMYVFLCIIVGISCLLSAACLRFYVSSRKICFSNLAAVPFPNDVVFPAAYTSMEDQAGTKAGLMTEYVSESGAVARAKCIY